LKDRSPHQENMGLAASRARIERALAGREPAVLGH